MQKKIIVPDEMLKAFHVALCRSREVDEDNALEAALRWLSENWECSEENSDYIEALNLYCVREHDQSFASKASFQRGWNAAYRYGMRRMFLAPEPEYIGSEELGRFCARYQRIDEAVIEAYRRGKESK